MAVVTGIPPVFLLDDEQMLRTIIEVIGERNEAERKAAQR